MLAQFLLHVADHFAGVRVSQPLRVKVIFAIDRSLKMQPAPRAVFQIVAHYLLNVWTHLTRLSMANFQPKLAT